MSIDVTAISELDSGAITERKAVIKALLEELLPTYDFSDSSVLGQILLYPQAVLNTAARTELDRLLASLTLNGIQANPALTDDDIVDALLSNFSFTRSSGTAAAGNLVLVLSSNVETAVTSDILFTYDGRSFATTEAYTGRIDEDDVVEDTDRMIQIRTDGLYQFVVPVQEIVAGGNAIASGTVFDANTALPGVTSIYAAEAFTAGTPAETTAALVARRQEGLAVRTIGDRTSLVTLLKDNFSSLLAASVIGHGDSELTRNGHNILGIKPGGATDVYIRTGTTPSVFKGTVLVTPAAAIDGNTIYTVSLSPSVFPVGLQRILDVRVAKPSEAYSDTGSSIPFTEVSRSLGTIDEDVSPSIYASSEGAFSSYQGAVALRATDSMTQSAHTAAVLANVGDMESVYINGEYVTVANLTTSLNAGSRLYDVYVDYLPYVGHIQAFINEREQANPTLDVLVRAAIPCHVSATVTIEYTDDGDEPDEDDIKNAVANYINGTGVGSAGLSCVAIADAIGEVLESNARVALPITLTGDTLKPNGEEEETTSTTTLVVPTDYPNNVSYRTAAFYADPDNIDVTLTLVET